MITSPVSSRSSYRNLRGLFLAVFGALALAVATFAAEAAKKNYNLPAADAVDSLKQFSDQSGEQIVYPVEQVRGVKTNAVTGEFTARAALDVMLRNTGLEAVQDEKTGALSVKKGPAKSETNAIKLETITVLGSRIRQTESAGPSPVNIYDAEYIHATGAMTLADFMNYLPQNYTGIASGRGSTPNELNPEFGQRTESTTPSFNFVTGSSSAPPGQTGVSGVSLRGLGSGSTLVLVDGRRVASSGAGNRSSDTQQGFVDLNTIPLGMIDHIEVTTDGASAIYGADAVAGVINIVLKKNYTGTELSGGISMAEHGGGRERNASLSQGFTHGKWNGSISLEYFDRQSLKGAQRDFADNQNHSAIPTGIITATGAIRYGVDYRLNYGYPAVIQASGGVVSGNFDALPGIRVVLVPVGSTGTPTLSQFIPVTTPAGTATVVNASAQRRYDTSSFLDLIPESQRTGASGNLQYHINEQTDLYGSARTSDTRSLTNAQIAGNSITGSFGAAATLPAALNPFNQNVTVSMILPEWGSATQRMRTLDDALTAGIRGHAAKTWEWDLGSTWEHQKSMQITRSYNGAGFANLLTNPDPAKRFNPFIDYTAPGAPSQAALLETLSVYPSFHTDSKSEGLDFSADGDLFHIPGGEVKMAFGGSLALDQVEDLSVTWSAVALPSPTTTLLSGSQHSNALFAEFSIPVFGKGNALPLLKRLDVQLAGRREEVGPFTKSVPKFGVSWTPATWLLVRGSWSQGFRAPGVTEYLIPPGASILTETDPLRTPTSTPNVAVSRGSNPDPRPELSNNGFVGLVLEPSFIKNLSLQANYYDTVVTDTLELLSAQTIINNEALFPGRVTRAAPTAADIALNQPGQITAVSQVFVNFGRVVNRSIDLQADYRIPAEQFGTFRISLAASHTIEATRALAPGQPPVVLDGDTSSPPKWKLNGSVLWNKNHWNASAFLWYLSAFDSNNAGNPLVADSTSVVFYPTPAVAKLDLRVGYDFEKGVWRGHGKGLRIGFGVSNVFDKKPPFSDTVWGFNAGLHSQLILGRAYEFSFVLPL